MKEPNKADIVEELKDKKNVSIAFIQRKYKVGFKLALVIYKDLKEKE